MQVMLAEVSEDCRMDGLKTELLQSLYERGGDVRMGRRRRMVRGAFQGIFRGALTGESLQGTGRGSIRGVMCSVAGEGTVEEGRRRRKGADSARRGR
jgi:hypothetical protein